MPCWPRYLTPQNVSFLFCSMATYSGISDSVRFPNQRDQLRFSSRVEEVCWPPFANPYAEGSDGCDADTDFVPFRVATSRSMRMAKSCECKGGRFSSSRYIATVTYTPPWRQRFIKAYLPAIIIGFINGASFDAASCSLV